MTDLAIIIVNYNTKDLLRKCLHSILTKKWRNSIEIWVVDNASGDGSVNMVEKEFPKIKLIKSDKNLGFSGGNNLGLKKAQARYYLLLNSDTEVTSGSLDALLDSMEKNTFEVASCKLVNPDGSLQPNAGNLPFGISLFTWLFGLDDIPLIRNYLPSFHQTKTSYYKNEREVGWVSGSVIAFRNEVLDKAGLWDDHIFMYGEEVDYCIRAKKAGFKIGWTDKAVIMHLGGGSSNDPHFRQWAGEFKGLLYLYNKYYGNFASMILKSLIYTAIVFRIFAFFVLGKSDYVKTYRKVLSEI
jgi:GT2 family glycosyltransferase